MYTILFIGIVNIIIVKTCTRIWTGWKQKSNKNARNISKNHSNKLEHEFNMNLLKDHEKNNGK